MTDQVANKPTYLIFVNRLFITKRCDMVNKNTSGVKKVAWPRKTTATKRTDMRVWPRLMQQHYGYPEMK